MRLATVCTASAKNRNTDNRIHEIAVGAKHDRRFAAGHVNETEKKES